MTSSEMRPKGLSLSSKPVVNMLVLDKEELKKMNNVFLGKPPASIEQWIKDHHGPAGHPETRVKYTEDRRITPRE